MHTGRITAGLLAPFALLSAGGPAGAQDGNAVELVGEFARWEEKRIAESSGLLWWRDRLITTNDSGDEAVLYVADRTGRETARLRYADSDPTDVEALALGPDGTIWVGDIGDNAQQRSTITVVRVPSPPLDHDDRVSGTRYDLRYPDGPHNAEALLVHPTTGAFYVVTKALVGAIYRAPQPLRADGVNALAYVGPAPAIVTDATFAPGGAQVYLRGYASVTVLDYPDFTLRATWPTPAQPQGEGLANGPDGTLLASTEGSRSAIQQWRMPPLPARVGATGASPTSSFPAPTASPAAAPIASESSAPESSAPESSAPEAPGSAAEARRWRVVAPALALAVAAAGALGALRNRRRRGLL